MKKHIVRFLGHEIRNPLNTVAMGLKYLETQFFCEDTEKKADCAETLNDCKASCDEAVEILNQLLLHEKIESNLLVLEKDYTAIKDFLNSNIKPYLHRVY